MSRIMNISNSHRPERLSFRTSPHILKAILAPGKTSPRLIVTGPSVPDTTDWPWPSATVQVTRAAGMSAAPWCAILIYPPKASSVVQAYFSISSSGTVSQQNCRHASGLMSPVDSMKTLSIPTKAVP